MVVLTSFPPANGGVYWQITDRSNPDVLKIAVDKRGAMHPAVTAISRVQDAREETWNLDLDALRADVAHTHPQGARHYPAWASGQLNARPSRAGTPMLIFEITPEMMQ